MHVHDIHVHDIHVHDIHVHDIDVHDIHVIDQWHSNCGPLTSLVRPFNSQMEMRKHRHFSTDVDVDHSRSIMTISVKRTPATKKVCLQFISMTQHILISSYRVVYSVYPCSPCTHVLCVLDISCHNHFVQK